MTYTEMEKKLDSLSMFTDNECGLIMAHAGASTVGTIIVVCETLGFELYASDIDEIINVFMD